jgi:uncharacterized protein
MEIATDFELPLAADDAYRMLLDLEQVAPCMPGASLGAERDDGSRELTVTVRLGPMKFVYGGTVHISERHDEERRAVLVGAADEQRGQGSASATITMTVAANGEDASRVASVAVLDLTGRAAQTGRGIVEDVSRRMVRDMASCLAAKAAPAEPEPAAPASAAGGESAANPQSASAAGPPAPAPQAKPISAGRLFFFLLWERLVRLWRRLGAWLRRRGR